MPSRNIKSYIAVVAVAAAVGFAAPAVAPVGFAAAPASALATGPGEGAGRASTQDVHLTHLPAMYDDPHGYFDVRVSFPSSGTVRLSWTYPSGDPLLSPGRTIYSRNVAVAIK